MKHPHDLPAGAFPFLPAESRRLPNPAYTWADRRDVPPWITLTLTLLRDGADANGSPPADWLRAASENDEFSTAMRGFADEQLNLASLAYDKLDAPGFIVTWTVKTTGKPVNGDAALASIWQGYSAALLCDLEAFGENPASALTRIARHWEQHQLYKQKAFLAEYMERDAWSPAMAAAWFMFGGCPELLAQYFNHGAELRVCGMALVRLGSTLEGIAEEQVVDHRPADTLLTAMRRSASSAKRVIAKGMLDGDGLLREITPADMARMEWDLNSADANVLLRDDWQSTNRTTVFAGVVIDRESLFRARPPAAPADLSANDTREPQKVKAGRKPTVSMRAKEALRSIVEKHGKVALTWTVPALQQTALDECRAEIKETTMRGVLKAMQAEA